MPKRSHRFLASLVVISLIGWIPATADADNAPQVAEAAPSVTVGDFLLRYASAMSLPLPEGASADEAIAALQAEGIIEEQVDSGQILTEGDVVKFASRAGLRLTTLNENRVFSSGRVDNFFDSFGGAISVPGSSTAGVAGGGDLNSSKKKKKRKHKKRKKKKDFESPVDDDEEDEEDEENEGEHDDHHFQQGDDDD